MNRSTSQSTPGSTWSHRILRLVGLSGSAIRPACSQSNARRRPVVEALEDRTLMDASLGQLLAAPQQDFIDGLYSELLNRGPDVQEATSLTNDLTSGKSRTDLVAQVLAGMEYVSSHGSDWLASLYDEVLGRQPDSRSMSAWQTALKQGMSKESIVRSFLSGVEFQRLSAEASALSFNADGGPMTTTSTAAANTGLLVQVKPNIANGLVRLTTALKGAAVAEPTDVPGLFRINGAASDLTRLAPTLRKQTFVKRVETEQLGAVTATANDPGFTNGNLWGLTGSNGIGAATAWNKTTGSTKVVVADVDTGVDYNHPDLYKNIWVNQAEVPSSWLSKSSNNSGYDRTINKSQVRDVDSDGKITFWDLNDSANSGLVWDNNGDSRIDGGDILRPRNQGGWEDGADAGSNGYIDDIVGWNFIGRNNKPMDDVNHGTHVAGTIGAIGNNGVGVTGVNWKTQIMALKAAYRVVLQNGAVSGAFPTAEAAAAIYYSANNGAKVANHSWGGPGDMPSVKEAFVYAGTKGQVAAISAGNSAENISTKPAYPAAYHLSNMIVVAAIDSNGRLANFSNYSATLVDVAAPGVDIASTVPGGNYEEFQGTSMAAPHVAGVAALLQAANPSMTVAQVISQIKKNTTPLSALSGRTVTGGTLNAAKALGSVSTTPGVPATPDTPTYNSSTSTLSWNSVSGAASYVIQSSSDGGAWSQYGTVSSNSATVQAGAYYRVAAANSTGTSAFSAAVYAGQQQSGQAPAVPTQLSWTSRGSYDITLSWGAVSGATSYDVQWWDSTNSTWVDFGAYSGTSVQVTSGLGNYWRVRAVNSVGASAYSNYLQAGQAPSQPSWSSAGGSDIFLSWNNVGATSYVVQYWSSNSSDWATLGNYTSTSIKIFYGYSYYWRVGAVYAGSSPLFSQYTLAQ